MSKIRPIIDSHLDLSWNAVQWNRDLRQDVAAIRQRESGMTDRKARGRSTVALPDMRRGRIILCLGTLLVRAKSDVSPAEGFRRTDLDVATQEIAYSVAQGQLAYYRALQERGEITIVCTGRELEAHWDSAKGKPDFPVGVVIAMEGADPIIEPHHLERWWRDGLRAVGLAHYGQGHYAMGTGGSGPLTAKGRALIDEVNRLGMILDLTHSSDPSFFEAIGRCTAPVMASHNNCRALVAGDRQFSNEQIKLLIQRGGVIGAAFDAWMLQPGFVVGESKGQDVPLDRVVDHIDHVCQIAGNSRHAAIGSDLDGGFGTEQSPAGVDTIADLQQLEPILRARGYDDADTDNIFHGNWLRFLRESLPSQ